MEKFDPGGERAIGAIGAIGPIGAIGRDGARERHRLFVEPADRGFSAGTSLLILRFFADAQNDRGHGLSTT